MIFSESPKVALLDGTMLAWAIWVAAHGAAAIITILTIVGLALRVMILWRQWKGVK